MSQFGLLVITYINDDSNDRRVKVRVKKQFIETFDVEHARMLQNALLGAKMPVDHPAYSEEYHVAYRHYLRSGGSVTFTEKEMKDLSYVTQDFFSAMESPTKAF